MKVFSSNLKERDSFKALETTTGDLEIVCSGHSLANVLSIFFNPDLGKSNENRLKLKTTNTQTFLISINLKWSANFLADRKINELILI